MSTTPTDHRAIADACEMSDIGTLVRDEYADLLWRAFMLAPDVATCAALLLGEDVPEDRLDPDWVARFGRRS